MADERNGFFFNVEKFLGSTAVRRMSFSEVGVYVGMMCQQWRDKQKNLPDSATGVAELIAVTPGQAAEVEAAWEVVRRKFVTSKHSTDRIYNIEIEATRRKQRAYLRDKREAGARGGKAKASNHQKTDALQASSARAVLEHTPSSALAKPTDLIRSDQKRRDPIREEREPPHAHNGTVFEGALHRDHRDHVFCDPTFSICVPSQVHAKFLSPLSRKFDGDRQQAHEALRAWYAAVAEHLSPECVMGDAFKFWRPRFDAEFATAPANSYDAEVAAIIAKGPSKRP